MNVLQFKVLTSKPSISFVRIFSISKHLIQLSLLKCMVAVCCFFFCAGPIFAREPVHLTNRYFNAWYFPFCLCYFFSLCWLLLQEYIELPHVARAILDWNWIHFYDIVHYSFISFTLFTCWFRCAAADFDVANHFSRMLSTTGAKIANDFSLGLIEIM